MYFESVDEYEEEEQTIENDKEVDEARNFKKINSSNTYQINRNLSWGNEFYIIKR
jgi:hypothetical protein